MPTEVTNVTSNAHSSMGEVVAQYRAGNDTAQATATNTNTAQAHAGAMTGWVAAGETNTSRNGGARTLPYDPATDRAQAETLPFNPADGVPAVPLAQATGAAHNTEIQIQSAVAGLARARTGPLHEDGALPGNAASQPQSDGQARNTGRGATPQ
jgi:hypothetical protein